MEDGQLIVGTPVENVGSDYEFKGVIVAKFAKLNGAVRCVVENKERILHIFSAKNLRRLL